MSGEPDGDAAGASAEFWEPIYERRGPSNGMPNAVLAGVAAPLAAGTVLDLGCGLGDNSIWLAGLGWRVTAVDVSPTAVERVAARAAELDLGAQVTAECHDLARSFPEGSFDLVLALYLESPIDFGRDRALRKAAQAVAPGGLLLVVTHGSVSPWAWNQDPDTSFATPAESLASLQLEPDGWDVEISGALEREATGGPRMETVTVIDVVTAVRRRARNLTTTDDPG